VQLLTLSARPSATMLPALDLLAHEMRTAALEVQPVLMGATPDALIVDATTDIAAARRCCRLLRTTGIGAPLLAVVTEGGLVAVSPDWGVDDVLLCSAGPAEVDARLRLAVGRLDASAADEQGQVRAGPLVIDPGTYTARVRGRALDLTYKEFELLRHLAQHPGRVYTREQLLSEVWGFDYFGGTRTVDVHVRRLRAKLGSEYEALIGTVRQVGYKFVTPPVRTARDEPDLRAPRDKPDLRAPRDKPDMRAPRDKPDMTVHLTEEPAITG